MTQEPSDSQRLTDEIRYVGGEKMLDGLSPADRLVWNCQSLVLSRLRDHGDVSEAAVKAGVPAALTHEWRDGRCARLQGSAQRRRGLTSGEGCCEKSPHRSLRARSETRPS